MTKWIRWSGLAGFTLFIALMVALFLFGLPWIIKTSIEFGGTKAAGAKVTLDDVDVTLVPLGVKLTHLQVADARQPMRNLVEFDTAMADLELAPLLLGKTISDELSITNLQFNTERTESGAIEKKDKDAEGEDTSKEPSITEQISQELPSADDILNRETLKTPTAGKELQQTWKASKNKVEEAVAQVPTEADLKHYEQEIKDITSGRLESIEDYQQRKKRFDELKKKFKQDKAAITSARDAIQQSRSDVQAAADTLRKAPGEDLAYLKDKYQFNTDGAMNLTGLLLGEDIEHWSREALYWYEKVKPYLNSGEAEIEEDDESAPRMIGRVVHFPTANPWPDFLIRKAKLSGPLDGGFLIIEGRDITHQQAVMGKPTRFTARGKELQSIGDLDAVLTLNHIQPIGKDELTLAISDWKMAPLDLGISGAQLASSNVQIQAKALVTQGMLDASSLASVTNARFTGQGKTQFAKELNSALAGISSFSVNAGAVGELTHPDIKLGSDLDRQLQAAFKQRLKAKQVELEQKLEAYLNQQVTEYAGDYADELQAFMDMEGSLTERFSTLEDLAKSKLEDFKAQQERELKAKLAKEKAEAEARLAKEKAEAEARIAKEKAAAEAKAKAEKEAAEAKLAKEKAEAEAKVRAEKEAAEAKAREEAKRQEEEAKKKAVEKLKGLF